MTLTATLDSDPLVSISFTTEVFKADRVSVAFEELINVYPNPCSEYVMIERSMPGTIEVISSRGQIIYVEDKADGSTRLDVSSYPAGIYFLRSYGDYGIETQKLMIYR